MKNFLLVLAQAGAALFAVVGLMALLNYALGWRLGFKGSAVPADPAMAALFFAIGAGLGFLVFRANKAGK